MASVTLEFPILIQTEKRENKRCYRVRPLFFHEIEGEGRRFNQAVSQLQKKVRKNFAQYKSNRSNINTLLWLCFQPELQFEKLKLEMKVGQRFISGFFTIVWFEIEKLRMVCLPGFDHHFFIAAKNEQGRYFIKQQANDFIQELFRKEQQKQGELRPEKYMATKGESLGFTNVTVHVQNEKFPFESELFDWFAFSSGNNVEFEGAREIYKTGRDLNELYPEELSRCYYQEEQVERFGSIVYQKENTPIALVGPNGIGKSTLVHEIVYRYMEKNKDHRFETLEKIWHIDPTRVISGMSIVGMWQNRFEAILEHAVKRLKKQRQSDKIFFDNPVALLRIGKSSQNDMTLSDVLKPYLEKRRLQVILEATPEEWKVIQEKARRFSDLFQVIRITEPEFDKAVKIAVKKRAQWERMYECTVSAEGLENIFTLHRTFLRRHCLPGSVLKFLRQVCTKYKNGEIDAQKIRKEFQITHRLSDRIFERNKRLKRDAVIEALSKNLAGQQQAIQAIADVIFVIKSCLSNPQKPFASFLFIGPTGVGKTQAAKALAHYLFGSEDSLIRFDMNEYIDDYSVQRLIGNMQNPEGQLTGKVRYRPFCVLLLDEIEKAGPAVHDLLLQVLGEGRLSDALGRTVDFTNTIIIMTSNIGARQASQNLGFGETGKDGIYQKATEDFFRPEFINRIDKVVVFENLTIENITQIAHAQIENLMQRDGFIRRTTILNIRSSALQMIAETGYEPEWGGRALKRQIEKNLTLITADQLISLPSELPIILEIFPCEEILASRVTPLQNVKKNQFIIPESPSSNNTESYFRKLHDKVVEIDQYVRSNKDNCCCSTEDYYLFREKVHEIKEELAEILWELEDVEISQSKPLIPTLARCRKIGSYNDKDLDYKTLFAQMEIRDYLNQLYQNAPAIILKEQQRYLQHYLKIAFLHFFYKSILEQPEEKYCLSIKSISSDKGHKEVHYLTKNYRQNFRALDMTLEHYIVEKGKAREEQNEGHLQNENYLIISGPRLKKLLSAETGLHLFYIPHSTPIPVEVSIARMKPDIDHKKFVEKLHRKNELFWEKLEKGKIHFSKIPAKKEKVIRYYCLIYQDLGDDTITDLRTGLINKTNMSFEEWKLLWYSNLPKKDRLIITG